MRVLLDTNVIIHREASTVVVREIGTLFNWLDRLNYQKYIHPSTIDEIRKHKDPRVVQTFEIKLANYTTLKTLAPESAEIAAIRAKFDANDNDAIDTSLISELFNNRVDFLITEDRKVHRKAAELGIAAQVFTIDTFLEKVVSEYPDLVSYKVLSVRKEYFGNVSIHDSFFDSFKHDYEGFDVWFNRKANEIAYVCKADNDVILAFLYIKIEDIGENYNDIQPRFESKRRLKIGTFKVSTNGFKLGERFLKIVFDNALQYRVDEIYVTIFDKTQDQQRLIELLKDWGFQYHGIKQTSSGTEHVYTRNFRANADTENPQLTYPYMSAVARKFIVPIYPQYHTELFPDSILRSESPTDFVENRPNRNAISKVYVSRSIVRDLHSGDIIVFYRTKAENAGYYTSVTTTLGIVQNVFTEISNLTQFIELCRKRSVYSDDELAEQWHHNPKSRPFIVNFLYVHTFPKKLILRDLMQLGIIDNAPRGFVQLSDSAFQTLLENSNADKRLIVNQT